MVSPTVIALLLVLYRYREHKAKATRCRIRQERLLAEMRMERRRRRSATPPPGPSRKRAHHDSASSSGLPLFSPIAPRNLPARRERSFALERIAEDCRLLDEFQAAAARPPTSPAINVENFAPGFEFEVASSSDESSNDDSGVSSATLSEDVWFVDEILDKRAGANGT